MKKLIATVLTVGLATGILAGCDNDPYMKEQDGQMVSIEYKVLIKDKLYYIPHEYDEADLPPRYDKFLTDNPNLEVVSVSTNNDESTHNSINGYYIFTKKKKNNSN